MPSAKNWGIEIANCVLPVTTMAWLGTVFTLTWPGVQMAVRPPSTGITAPVM